MASRSNTTDAGSQSHGPLSQNIRLPPPRFSATGVVPLELSPLDAFAARSRFLAQQLEQQMEQGENDGKRMSRLPPLMIENSLRQGRPSVFRSLSAQESLANLAKDTHLTSPALNTELEALSYRPTSIHPRMSSIPPQRMPYRGPSQRQFQEDKQQRRGRQSPRPVTEFGGRREQSPGSIGSTDLLSRQDISPSRFAPRPSLESAQQQGQSPRRRPDSRDHGSRPGPPRSLFALSNASVRSGSLDDSEDDFPVSTSGSFPSQHRTISPSSAGLSISPLFPPSLSTAIPARSPSALSDISATGTSSISRPPFNFSRPLSRATSDLSTDQLARQSSPESQPFLFSDETPQTPVSIHSEDLSDNSHEPAAPSYSHSILSLPRGKMLQRNSKLGQDNVAQAEFQWQLPNATNSNVQVYYHSDSGSAPPSPPSRQSTSSLEQRSLSGPFDAFSRPSHDQRRQDEGDGGFQHDAAQRKLETTSPQMVNVYHARPATSNTSGSTAKARSQYSLAPSAEGTAEEHVTRGIDLHEQGCLNESTYHLRIAARQHHPTGMLLYALACRHGWGIRPNQHEGVQWLRKAADHAILEIADDESQVRVGKSVDVVEQRTRKAQFALSVYELGVSHMNGWGIEQDKALALRCFEIAGAWGDGDALAEAGFCYAQGVGCKKDLKKSARFYRLAEARGLSMVGNSWIHKSKYKDDGNSDKDPTLSIDKKARSKSRTRSIFRRRDSKPTAVV